MQIVKALSPKGDAEAERLDNIWGGVQNARRISYSSNSKGVDGMADASEFDFRPS
jgi:hypothetical protein